MRHVIQQMKVREVHGSQERKTTGKYIINKYKQLGKVSKLSYYDNKEIRRLDHMNVHKLTIEGIYEENRMIEKEDSQFRCVKERKNRNTFAL